ncbi:hypothetical protein [Phaeovulum sp. NW3]|uniref:hypothetical protein n=1 Tax=Phaeovulum sp. NW3 TaxID=2934933 RepID=UPI002021900A|nr:hypothetical protein [Phaeovulum sp. NW3]MCL7466715.1 hypothetical protein [Phaeovulum sp. NW3]
MRAQLEGAMAKRRLRDSNAPLENINALVAPEGPQLLARARELAATALRSLLTRGPCRCDRT